MNDDKKLRKSLERLVKACKQVTTALDAEMRKPSDIERGKRIARITNFLEWEKDYAFHFGLEKALRLTQRMTVAALALSQPEKVGSGGWVDGGGVTGWKNVISRQLFESDEAAMQWAKANGLRNIKLVEASMPKTPSTVGK